MKEFTAWVDPEPTGVIPDSVNIVPSWISADDRGGSYKAEFNVEGPESALWKVPEWLGRKIHVYDPYGTDVWRGFVSEVSFNVGGFSASYAYSTMFNRIRVLYSFDGPDGQPGTGITEWVIDEQSVSEHFIREYLHSMADTFQNEAEAERDRLLGEFKQPSGTPTVGSQVIGATLNAVGAFQLNEWRYFERREGRFEHSFSPTIELNVGWSLSGTGFSFVFSKLHDIDARIETLTPGNKIVITGNFQWASTVLEVTGQPSGTQSETKSGSNIWLDPSDEIYINSPGNWDEFRAEEVVELSGTASHNSNYAIEDVNRTNNPQYLDLNGAFGLITDQENDQGTITITVKQGTSVELESGGLGVDDTFDDSLTIDALGQEVEQSFTSNFTGEAELIAISAMKVGTPFYDLVIELWNDQGGTRDNLISSVSVSPDDLPEVTQELWVTLDTPASIVEGDRYYVVIKMDGGANSNTDHYRIGLTEDVILSGEQLRLKAGITYFTYTDMSLTFMVYATEDTVTQMGKILDVSNQTDARYSFIPMLTGVRTNYYKDGRQRADTLLEELLDLGVSGGRRLIVKDDPDMNMIVSEEPAKDTTGKVKIVWADGRITSASGGPIPRGELPVGEWVEIAEASSDVTTVAGELSPVYVQYADIDLLGDNPPKLRSRNLSVNDRIGGL